VTTPGERGPRADVAAAVTIAADVKARRSSGTDQVRAALKRIAAHDPALNCFTEVLAERALATAARVDGAVALGADPGPLAGVPFAVKNLYDVAGLRTLAGSKINRDHAPAARDAAAVRALEGAGAVLVGALNMDEYAFGFTTENTHYGPTHNPHDLARVAGGSSGGSAAAVAAGLVPISLGSDTNGSIRVPAAFCGIFGLKPTYGRVSRAGVALFAGSFDHAGPFARSVADLAVTFEIIQGPDPDDPACADRPADPCLAELARGVAGLRIAVADGYFSRGGQPEAHAAVERVARALKADRRVTLPEAERARAAAVVITSAEGAELHLADLKTRAADFDPMTRERFLAGALIPATHYRAAQRFRAWYRDRVRRLFDDVDVILTPTTPFPAPLIGQQTIEIASDRDSPPEPLPVRALIGLYTQPISFIGLPALSVPVPVPGPGSLPLGVQLVAAPWRESVLLRVAAALEADGVARPA
jgi:AtzE family amidohydrolase